MLIAAALIELELGEADSIKDKRKVVRSVKDRLRERFNVSVAEVAAQDERHSICIGCVKVGIDAKHLREQLEGAVRFVESLGLAEVVGDDVTVVRLDELTELAGEAGEGEADDEWQRQLARDWEDE
jgi:uncharacterized protein YlxP (DUF503 family)